MDIIWSFLGSILYGMLKPLDWHTKGLREKIFISLAFKDRKVGILKTYKHSKDAYSDIEPYFKSSSIARIMQIRGHDLIDGDILTKHLPLRNEKKLETQILLLNPNSIYASIRAKNLKQDPKSYSRKIEGSIKQLSDLIRRKKLNIEFCLYSKEPIYCIFLFEDALFLSFYSEMESHQRQNVECYKVGKTSMLYESIYKYFDFVWNEESSPIDELKEHYEIEKKYKIVNYQEFYSIFNQIQVKDINESNYEDYYFTRKNGKHFEENEREYRIRVNLNNKKVFLTKKRKMKGHHKESKVEIETYVGYYDKINYIIKRVESNGYVLYSTFRKKTKNYLIKYKKKDQLTGFSDLDVSFVLTISSLENGKFEIIHPLFDSIFLEIETLVPKNTSIEKVDYLNKEIDDIAAMFRDTIQSCDTKYSEICRFN